MPHGTAASQPVTRAGAKSMGATAGAGSTAAGCEADLGVGFSEAGGLSGGSEITGQRQVHAASNGKPVDRSNDWFVEPC